jgi:hypothetical protein
VREEYAITEHQFARLHTAITLFVTLGIWSLLDWQSFHDGVPAHHILHRADIRRSPTGEAASSSPF